jgi:hypothetical protein
MTSDRLLLTPRTVGRIITFVITLAVGIGLGQIVPLRVFVSSSEKAPVMKQVKRDCPYSRR